MMLTKIHLSSQTNVELCAAPTNYVYRDHSAILFTTRVRMKFQIIFDLPRMYRLIFQMEIQYTNYRKFNIRFVVAHVTLKKKRR